MRLRAASKVESGIESANWSQALSGWPRLTCSAVRAAGLMRSLITNPPVHSLQHLPGNLIEGAATRLMNRAELEKSRQASENDIAINGIEFDSVAKTHLRAAR